MRLRTPPEGEFQVSVKIAVFEQELVLEETRVEVTAIGDGYSATVTAVLEGGDTLGALSRFVPSFEGGLIEAASATVEELIPQLRSMWEAAGQS